MSAQGFLPEDIQSFFKTIETQTSTLFENFAESFYGKAETLRDGTEYAPVTLPRDLYAHSGAQTEWWYYTGHAETTLGKKFGFEFVFFKRRTDLDKFGLVPLRILGNPLYFAHFAITDIEKGKFQYSHRKSAGGLFDLPAEMSEKHYYLKLGDWTIRESNGSHILRATMGKDISFEATLTPSKKIIFNGEKSDGVSYKDKGEASRYFSYTRMEMEGDISIGGGTEHFKGSAWMDREFGTWTPTENQKGWDWFSIQMNDDTELMCYQLRDSKGHISEYSSGAFVDKEGNRTHLGKEDFVLEPTGIWKSPKTEAEYPSGWRLKVPKFELDLEITPVIKEQELDTRGTTMIVYWEGMCEVCGTKGDRGISGNAYAELVGYDRSHENPNLAYFLMGNSFDFPGGIFS